MKNWIVLMPMAVTISPAETEDDARSEVLERFGYERKPWLARDWIVREATDAELTRYAALADNYRPSQPTAKTSAKPRKPTQARLV